MRTKEVYLRRTSTGQHVKILQTDKGISSYLYAEGFNSQYGVFQLEATELDRVVQIYVAKGYRIIKTTGLWNDASNYLSYWSQSGT